MKYLLALGFLGMASAHTYERISSGYCEDSGYENVLDETECETEGEALAHPNGIAGDYITAGVWFGYPVGCMQKQDTSVIYLKPNLHNSDPEAGFPCGYNNYDCICRVPDPPAAGGGGGAGSEAGDCCAGCTPAQYIDAQCCQC